MGDHRQQAPIPHKARPQAPQSIRLTLNPINQIKGSPGIQKPPGGFDLKPIGAGQRLQRHRAIRQLLKQIKGDQSRQNLGINKARAQIEKRRRPFAGNRPGEGKARCLKTKAATG
ncbi:hypothetical protein JCM17846_30200 [Iodidimonas nitroreducens]|uniref:Uncharacterized protein n=1 Tax=Iodidimonas nitroreducens TaxID=1236968 RepID=A0A5A7NB54_9PROT|nr:hypothetical protein JCM17846_30200 [Iodidimonas nitroreducens]